MNSPFSPLKAGAASIENDLRAPPNVIGRPEALLTRRRNVIDFDDDREDCEEYDRDDYYEDDEPIDGVGFADPGGNSALRAATENNPRNLPCPSCGAPNRLTPLDRSRGYRCDACADRAEGRMGGEY